MSGIAGPCAVIVKFGGSVLTDKKQLESIDSRGLASCVRLASQLPPRSCVVHGAGSFGHFHAARYNVKAGTSACGAAGEGEDLPAGWGMCATRRSVMKLSSTVVSALIDARTAATAVHPMDSWSCCDAAVSSAGLTCVQRCLQLGILPVLHGDVVFDSCRGYTVLSGDDIVQQLSDRLRPPFVLFVSDVAGVFLQPPASGAAATAGDPGFVTLCVVDCQGSIVRLHTSAESQQHEPAALHAGGSSGTDITGGMRKKLQSACCIAASGVPVAICSPEISSLPPAFGSCTWIVRAGAQLPAPALALGAQTA